MVLDITSCIENIISTVKIYVHIDIDKETAIKIYDWDLGNDRSFVDELSDDGQLDTCPRDYLVMALVEVLMPGKPEVQDDSLGETHDTWHWPMNGSSGKYKKSIF